MVIPDGGWNRTPGNEDPDAPRRLYYVAMTRAKETLTLMETGQGNPSTKILREKGDPMERPGPVEVPESTREMRRKFFRTTMKDVNLSFAGRYGERHEVHGAIETLTPGDPLVVRTGQEPWEPETPGGVTVERMARTWQAPREDGEVRARVLAVIKWTKDKSEPQYQDRLRRDEWETVIPEFVVTPRSEDCGSLARQRHGRLQVRKQRLSGRHTSAIPT